MQRQSEQCVGLCRYELQHLVRTHMGGDDESYHCVFQQEDAEGIRGVKLDKVPTGAAFYACDHIGILWLTLCLQIRDCARQMMRMMSEHTKVKSHEIVPFRQSSVQLYLS